MKLRAPNEVEGRAGHRALFETAADNLGMRMLEPTLASKLQGDYRTGKRISMRKVIPYIASGFRKDKIWLRRTKPSKREYQVMLCIDDSESMQNTGAGNLACEASRRPGGSRLSHTGLEGHESAIPGAQDDDASALKAWLDK